ncbi:MAG: translocation/assembly module TamB domain-containing protein [Candidatus Solibacter sp.]
MMRKRTIWRILLALAGLLAIVGIWAVYIVQTAWFFDKVRTAIIDTVETATGGRVELASFRFDWRQMRAEVHGFVLHGTEAADKPPLLRAGSVAVGLKIVSLLRKDVDIQSLTISDPRVYLVIGPDGRTNFPEPKIKSTSKSNTVEDILKLAIDRFVLERGIFEIEAQTRIPFAARGENLNVALAYELLGPRYRGRLAIQPLYLSYDDYGPAPFNVNLAVSMEKNRIAIDSGTLVTGATQINVKGALEDLAAPHAAFEYQARVAIPDIAQIFRVPQLRNGKAEVGGTGTWAPGDGLDLRGTLHARDLEYRDTTIRLVGFSGEGAVSASTLGVAAAGLRLAGFYANGERREAVQGRVGTFMLFKNDIDIDGIALTLLTGTFRGKARLAHLDHYTVAGEISGIDTRRTVALYSTAALPWNALVFGPLTLEGSLKRSSELRATGALTLAPAPAGEPVRGQLNVAYDAARGTLDVGRSTVTLPHSRADFSGALNSELKVHAETTDLMDVLPVLGDSAAALPIKLQNGSAQFDGSVTGNLDNPRIAGHLRAANVVYSGQHADALEADVALAADYLRVQNGSAVEGSLRAQLQGSIGLSDWKTADTSPVAGTATVSNASLTELASLLNAKELPISGTLNSTAQVNGTVSTLRAQADVELLKGKLQDEPFDRFTARATYAANTLTVANGVLSAGAKQVRLSATLQHQPGKFDTGRLRFNVATNLMPAEDIQTLVQARPGIRGTLQVTAGGEIELQPTAKIPYRIDALRADLETKSVEIDGQALGESRLTATSQGQVLHAHIESSIAGSVLKGDGEWRLEGEYPGSANLTFSQLDLARLKPWLSSSGTGEPAQFAGSAEGAIHVEGPAANWRAMKAELRIPEFQLGAAPGVTAASGALTLKNSGPIVVRYANSVVNVESAHLIGRSTDLNLTGRYSLDQKSPLDARLNGRLDLAFLQDFSEDFESSGTVVTDATVRGTFTDPLINGRMTFEKAAFNIVDVPNGISEASGTVVFTKDRATIQSLSGETGGGKIDLSGFASYGGGQLVFRLHARAREVRVRYPEGVSTVANASLNLTGTTDSSMLSGTVTILRTGINLQSDFSGILAKSAEPVQTPSARKGLLGGMSFDVQIETSPDIQLQSSLTENLQAEANLRVRGTASNPAILGRINITQGKLTFFGTKYTLSQGSIGFYNPAKVEPIINIDLETKARGIDITLTVSGPLTKLSLTPRSDPPLQFSEIVALLATGRTPTSDPSLLTQRSNEPQSWQQMGASALLGSAIANPVAGRLQRFFGVSKLRIDPTLSGVENNPQARLTLEQQVTPAITFTYITNVTSSNPQVVRVEWAFSKEWSAVALREENGLFGLDFFYKRRFK